MKEGNGPSVRPFSPRPSKVTQRRACWRRCGPRKDRAAMDAVGLKGRGVSWLAAGSKRTAVDTGAGAGRLVHPTHGRARWARDVG